MVFQLAILVIALAICSESWAGQARGTRSDSNRRSNVRKQTQAAAARPRSVAGSTASSGASHSVRQPTSAATGSFAGMAGEQRAVEVRGQSRTLSMMLVLKNGKENVDFVKPRKDYNSEILATQF
ncbi:MAG: hypothetical protein C5B49_09225 [Bdellovibrio sp.]|nr:MAG: hypothetical protein C5B49_09225 [Bdellovibrio sp.]